MSYSTDEKRILELNKQILELKEEMMKKLETLEGERTALVITCDLEYDEREDWNGPRFFPAFEDICELMNIN